MTCNQERDTIQGMAIKQMQTCLVLKGKPKTMKLITVRTTTIMWKIRNGFAG